MKGETDMSEQVNKDVTIETPTDAEAQEGEQAVQAARKEAAPPPQESRRLGVNPTSS